MDELLYSKYVKGKFKTFFIEKVIDISQKLNIVPDWLMVVMFSESTFDQTKINPVTKAVGLIQFMPNTAAYLIYNDLDKAKNSSYQKAATSLLSKMTITRQLDYVYKYFAPYKGLINGVEDLYLITFYPNAGGKLGGTLSKPDSWKFPKDVTAANGYIPGKRSGGIDVDADGDITIATFKTWVDKKVTKKDSTYVAAKSQALVQTKKNQPASTTAVDDKSYITYVHTYSTITTVDQLITYKGWRDQVTGQAITANDLVGDDVGYKQDNKNAIRAAFSKKDNKAIANGSEKNNLKIGVRLKIPRRYVTPEFITFDGAQNIVTNDDTETFISDALERIVTSPEYRFTFNSGSAFGSVRKSLPKARVWIWCKSLANQNMPGYPKFSGDGAIFDLSPFIENLTTTVSANGGNFNFSLPPLTCECELNGWVIKKNTIRTFNSNPTTTNKSFQAKGVLHKDNSNGELRRNDFLFHNMINENDIVFISVDTPEFETIEDFKTYIQNQNIANPRVDKSFLPGSVYDMIGLVDTNRCSFEAGSNTVRVSIGGRDLIKTVIEDSSYYLQMTQTPTDNQGLFRNDNPDNWGRPFRSTKFDGSNPIVALGIQSPRTVGEMVSYIFNGMATIEICPDNLFQAYENQTGGYGISKYAYYDIVEQKPKLFRGAGIWQIIKLQIDQENVNDRYILDGSLAVFSGSLLNAIRIFCDGVFIEMMSDTYLDQFFFIIRRPPYNQKSVMDYLNKLTYNTSGLIVDESQVVDDSLEWNTGEAYCWYKLQTNQNSFGKRQDVITNSWPVVYFREYCEIWGNKAMDVVSNYIPFDSIVANRDLINGSVYQTQMYEDLAYLVESNAYLPFTRKGTIVIKMDRRLKRGVWMRYQPTGEVFYIESVTHSYNVNMNSTDAITTLQVSRGMVEYNASGQYILPYYFQIIDGLPNEAAQPKPPVLQTKTDAPIPLELYFDFDRTVLIELNRDDLTEHVDLEQDSAKRQQLKETSEKSIEALYQDLKNDPTLTILLTGHTDERGSDFYNQKLGQLRADSVKREIVQNWNAINSEPFDESRITTDSKGETYKLDLRDPHNPKIMREVLANNRRVEATYTRQVTADNSQAGSNTSNTTVNDYSKWKVNQEIFNFFLNRKQFCDKIDDLDSLGNYSTPNKPLPLIVDIDNEAVNVVPQNTASNDLAYQSSVGTNPTMVGRGDSQEDPVS